MSDLDSDPNYQQAFVASLHKVKNLQLA